MKRLYGLACTALLACGCSTLSLTETSSLTGTAPAETNLAVASNQLPVASPQFDPSPLPAVEGLRVSDRFPNVEVQSHDGRTFRFVDDLIRDRVVLINFSYTQCRGSCPGTNAVLARLRQELQPEFGSSLRILSITLDPTVDTPEVLAKFAKNLSPRAESDEPEWLFLTGAADDLEAIRFALGQSEPDPVLDADITQHSAVLTFGNDRLNRWAAIPSGTAVPHLTETIVRIAGQSQDQRFRRLSPSRRPIPGFSGL